MSYNLRSRSSDTDTMSSLRIRANGTMAAVSRSASPSPSRNSSCSSTHGNPEQDTFEFSSSSHKFADSFHTKIFKTSAITYAFVMMIAILGGGSIIRLYGETCGLSIMEPSSWLRATVTIGSPWCKALNWAGYMTTCIVEHMWFHLFGVITTTFIAYVPGKFQSREAGTYHDKRN